MRIIKPVPHILSKVPSCVCTCHVLVTSIQNKNITYVII